MQENSSISKEQDIQISNNEIQKSDDFKKVSYEITIEKLKHEIIVLMESQDKRYREYNTKFQSVKKMANQTLNKLDALKPKHHKELVLEIQDNEESQKTINKLAEVTNLTNYLDKFQPLKIKLSKGLQQLCDLLLIQDQEINGYNNDWLKLQKMSLEAIKTVVPKDHNEKLIENLNSRMDSKKKNDEVFQASEARLEGGFQKLLSVLKPRIKILTEYLKILNSEPQYLDGREEFISFLQTRDKEYDECLKDFHALRTKQYDSFKKLYNQLKTQDKTINTCHQKIPALKKKLITGDPYSFDLQSISFDLPSIRSGMLRNLEASKPYIENHAVATFNQGDNNQETKLPIKEQPIKIFKRWLEQGGKKTIHDLGVKKKQKSEQEEKKFEAFQEAYIQQQASEKVINKEAKNAQQNQHFRSLKNNGVNKSISNINSWKPQESQQQQILSISQLENDGVNNFISCINSLASQQQQILSFSGLKNNGVNKSISPINSLESQQQQILSISLLKNDGVNNFISCINSLESQQQQILSFGSLKNNGVNKSISNINALASQQQQILSFGGLKNDEVNKSISNINSWKPQESQQQQIPSFSGLKNNGVNKSISNINSLASQIPSFGGLKNNGVNKSISPINSWKPQESQQQQIPSSQLKERDALLQEQLKASQLQNITLPKQNQNIQGNQSWVKSIRNNNNKKEDKDKNQGGRDF